MNMRSILHASVLALFAGTAYAQSLPSLPTTYTAGNDATIEQIGTGNHVGTASTTGIDQQLNSSSATNYAGVYQGNNNPAYAAWTSTSNTATVQQVAAGAAVNASLTLQGGSGNTATTKQNTNGTAGGTVVFNLPPLLPQTPAPISVGSPYYSFATVGSNSRASGTFVSVIDQTQSSTALAGVYQGTWNGPAATGTAYSSVTQSGSAVQAFGYSNYITVIQKEAANNWSLADQYLSKATITQGGYTGRNNVSVLYQVSAENADLTQLAYGGNNTSYINQEGGTVTLTQTAYTGANSSTIWQLGGSGTLDVKQTVDVNATSGSNNSSIWQNNVANSVSVTQEVLTSGTNNSYINQTGGDYTVKQTAVGGTNNSYIDSDGGTSKITQTASLGFTNTSTVTQTGADKATVTQSQAILGGNNTSTITQTNTGGIENQAILSQTANYGANTSTIIQTGYGNIAKVTQR